MEYALQTGALEDTFLHTPEMHMTFAQLVQTHRSRVHGFSDVCCTDRML